MPLLRITSNQIPADANALLAEASLILARETGKPEAYVMVALNAPAAMLFAGSSGPAAFFDTRGIGLSPDTASRLSKRLSDLAMRTLSVPADRVFLNFTDVPANRWGFNGETFG